MKNTKQDILYIILGFTVIQLLKYFILIIYFNIDNDFYHGIYSKKNFVNIHDKILYMQLLPVLIYSVCFFIYFKKYSKNINLLKIILIFTITIILNSNFDYRDFLFFISNHRIKLYVSLFFSFIMIVIIYYLLKKNSPDSSDMSAQR